MSAYTAVLSAWALPSLAPPTADPPLVAAVTGAAAARVALDAAVGLPRPGTLPDAVGT
jgi:hypothetical protein